MVVKPATLRLGGWRGLGLFWAGVLACLGSLAATLQILGPPVEVQAPRPVAAASEAPARPGKDAPGPIAAPDLALLERVAGEPPRFPPRIAADGRAPMAVYAAGFAPGVQEPRVGLVLAGIGLDHAGSEMAAKTLPASVTLAVSPYAPGFDPLLTTIRATGHEDLLSIPMEPRGFALNNPGDRALMTSLAPEENARRLDWVLSRVAGYVGVTGALGRLRGERFAADADLMGPFLRAIGRRGLLYVDPRPDAPSLPSVWSRHIDLVVDDAGTAASVDAQLAELSRLARERGSALGLAGAVRPVTVERIAAWTRQLAAQGVTLAPVSALVEAPRKEGTPK